MNRSVARLKLIEGFSFSLIFVPETLTLLRFFVVREPEKRDTESLLWLALKPVILDMIPLRKYFLFEGFTCLVISSCF